MDIKKLTGHQLVVVIVRNGKDRLADQILQRKLGQNDRFILLNIRPVSYTHLGRVSVPMWPVTLSGRLLIVALVSRYLTN